MVYIRSYFREAREDKGPDCQHRVANGNVKVVPGGEQVEGDEQEPCRDDVGRVPGVAGENENAGGDFDDSCDVHQGGGRDGQNASGQRTQVVRPAREEVCKLVEPGHDGHEAIGQAQRPPGRVQSFIQHVEASEIGFRCQE